MGLDHKQWLVEGKCTSCGSARDTGKKTCTPCLRKISLKRLTNPKPSRHSSSKLHAKVIDYLGGKCVRCEFTDKRALQIDHIFGGGTKEINSGGGAYYKYLKDILVNTKAREKFQVLCANHNAIKRSENHEYGNGSRRKHFL